MSALALLGGPKSRERPFPTRRTMGEGEKRAVLEVMDSDDLSGFFGSPGPRWLGGAKVQAFERKWAEQYGFEHAICVNSWTTGLMTAVGAIGIEPGDEVIVPPYTMSATATAILFYGGIPVFADVDPGTFNITAATAQRCISARTRAIMVAHLFGQAADMDPLLQLAGRHGLRIIEDAAQAPGIRYKGRALGAIGDIGGFSLNYHKHIHTGEGGMLVTNDANLALRCRLIRNHGENLVEAHEVADLTNLLGSNYRLTELQAAIGIVQLDKLQGYLHTRRHLAERLRRHLTGIEGLEPAAQADGAEHAYYLYAFKVDAARIGMSRHRFVSAVNAELPAPQTWEQSGLIEGYVKPLYLAPLYQRKIALGSRGFPWTLNPSIEYSYAKGLCPTAERLHEHELVYTPLTREPLQDADIDDLADAVHKVIRHKAELLGRAA